MRGLFALLLIPALAGASVRYDVAARPVDESLSQIGASLPPVVTQYFVESGPATISRLTGVFYAGTKTGTALIKVEDDGLTELVDEYDI